MGKRKLKVHATKNWFRLRVRSPKIGAKTRMLTLSAKKVYSKTSHIKLAKKGFPPVYSVGTYNKNSFNVVTHMTPELKHHPAERKTLLRHEKREAKLLAEGKSVHYAHRQAASKDPKYLHGEKGFYNIWKRLGKLRRR